MAEKSSASIDYILKFKNILYSLILDKIGQKKNIKMLDIGCKDGNDLLNICRRSGISGYGMDMSRQYFSQAVTRAQKCGNIFFLQGLAEELPFRQGMFDIVLSSEVIEHLYDANKFLSEIHRVLTPGGYLFITTPPRYAYTALIGKVVPKKFKKRLRKFIYPYHSEMSGIKEIRPDGTIVKEHVYEYIPGELKRLIDNSGLFKVEAVRSGRLYIPIAPLFDKIPFLIKLWGIFDNLLDIFPFAIHFKANFIVMAKKVDK